MNFSDVLVEEIGGQDRGYYSELRLRQHEHAVAHAHDQVLTDAGHFVNDIDLSLALRTKPRVSCEAVTKQQKYREQLQRDEGQKNFEHYEGNELD